MMTKAQLILFCHFMQLSSRRRMQAAFLTFTSLTLKCPTALLLDSLTLDNYLFSFFGFLYFLITITKYLRETT